MAVEPAAQNGHKTWNEILLEPFDNEEIGTRPQVWCGDCRKAVKDGKKACLQGQGERQHKAQKCGVCGQNITTAHLHLYYVGHANVTYRLLAADPYWTWEPLAREIDHEVLSAAIASGNPEIVKLVLENSPPKLTELHISDSHGNTHVEYGMWIRLILHDDQGNPVTMIGFGDAKGKQWGGDALKEIIGDALRNAGMRRGAGLALWVKQDLEQARRERESQGGDPDDGRAGENARAALFNDDEPPAIGSGTPPPVDGDAQKWADQAWSYARQSMTPEQLRDGAYTPASRARKFTALVHPPWDDNPDARARLSEVLTRARRICEGKEEFPQPAGETAGA